LPHQIGHLFEIQRAGPHEGHELAFAAFVFDESFALGRDSGRRDGKHVVRLQGRVGDAPDMLQLIEDQPFGLMHRFGDAPPRFYLFAAVDARRPGITLSLHRYTRWLR
jgi:hypothetical protein